MVGGTTLSWQQQELSGVSKGTGGVLAQFWNIYSQAIRSVKWLRKWGVCIRSWGWLGDPRWSAIHCDQTFLAVVLAAQTACVWRFGIVRGMFWCTKGTGCSGTIWTGVSIEKSPWSRLSKEGRSSSLLVRRWRLRLSLESEGLVTVEGNWRGFRPPESPLQAVWTRWIVSFCNKISPVVYISRPVVTEVQVENSYEQEQNSNLEKMEVVCVNTALEENGWMDKFTVVIWYAKNFSFSK